MRQIDFYEFTGVVAPGVIVLLAAGLIWSEYWGSVLKLDLSLGGFGFALLISYVAGHLLQAIGNMIEVVWWKINGGWPSDWPRTKNKGGLLSDEQLTQLQKRIRDDFEFKDFTLSSQVSAKSWDSIFRQIAATICADGRNSRVYIFNGNYGMFRGIIAALLVACFGSLIIRGWEAWPMSIAFLAVAGLALFRMHRFAVHYARETFVQFLSLPRRKGDKL